MTMQLSARAVKVEECIAIFTNFTFYDAAPGIILSSFLENEDIDALLPEGVCKLLHLTSDGTNIYCLNTDLCICLCFAYLSTKLGLD